LNRAPPQKGARHSFLIDAGAAVAGYAADVTRTYSANDDEFAALIRKVHELQQTLCTQVRAGTSYIDIHLSAHRLIAEALRDFGLITTSAEDAVASGLSSVFFPHGVGHLLGLQVHDVAGFAKNPSGEEIPKPPGHPYLRLTRTLEPGFVVTIEPGIYFIDLLLEDAATKFKREIVWSKVEQLRKYGGVRIEDDVVCTTGEPVNLTREEFAQAL
jgi:Xaa-Pro dipeptidase